jgi:hypothetical protein
MFISHFIYWGLERPGSVWDVEFAAIAADVVIDSSTPVYAKIDSAYRGNCQHTPTGFFLPERVGSYFTG